MTNISIPAPTGTGLDKLIEIIGSDAKLAQGTSTADITAGMEAASAMNALIIEAIKSTGVADDGRFSKRDVVAINDYLVTNHADTWADLHGDDEDDVETGFHLVQSDGNRTLLYGVNAVDRVADSIYHLGFEMIGRSRLGNEDGEANQSTKKVAGWLNKLLADDLADGSLQSDKQGGSQVVLTVSNSGEPIPYQDPSFVPYYDDDLDLGDDLVSGSDGADVFRFQFNINTTPEIAARNLKADGTIAWHDVAGENGNVHDHWVTNGGDDTVLDFKAYEGDTIEVVGHTTNFWLSYDDVDDNGKEDTIINVWSDQGGYSVDRDGNFTGSPNGAHDGDVLGTITVLNAVLVGDEIYNDSKAHYGEYTTVAEMPAVDNPRPEPEPPQVPDDIALTGTGLDTLVDIILNDKKLAQGTPLDNIEEGAEAAAAMNALIVEGILSTGVAEDGAIQSSDIVTLNRFLLGNYADEWSELHGDDETGVETGFHLVQGNGNRTLLYGSNAVDRVADGIYHLGFEMLGRSRLADEDGNGNRSIYEVAEWMNDLLADDLNDGTLIA